MSDTPETCAYRLALESYSEKVIRCLRNAGSANVPSLFPPTSPLRRSDLHASISAVYFLSSVMLTEAPLRSSIFTTSFCPRAAACMHAAFTSEEK